MKIIAGNSNLPLSKLIAQNLHTNLAEASISKFADGEVNVEIKESVRGEDIFIIQSTSKPTNDNLMELLICIDALKRGSAKRITAVIPYFGYARQDRKQSPRAPISAKLVANLLTTAGADRILTLDLHASQIQGFFDIPVDNLYSNIIFLNHIKPTVDITNTVVVSPDVGGVVRARSFAKNLGCDLAIIDKRREKAGVSEVMNVVGDVNNKHCILIDDIADSAGTLCNAATALKKRGALTIKAFTTHGVFSKDALQRIANSHINEFMCTDTIYHAEVDMLQHPKLTVLSASNLLAESIKRIYTESSLSSLFLN